jgi:hypothetical protein
VVKAPDAWATHCPECKARLRLPVTVKEGPKIRGEQAIEARVTVDVTPMREHMKEKHGIVPASKQGT